MLIVYCVLLRMLKTWSSRTTMSGSFLGYLTQRLEVHDNDLCGLRLHRDSRDTVRQEHGHASRSAIPTPKNLGLLHISGCFSVQFLNA
jgi:hypothetical protein